MEKKLAEMEGMIQWIPWVPTPLKKSLPHSYTDSLFVNTISIMEILKQFTFPNMKLYDGTIDPIDHIASYKQKMFTTAIPQELHEACMCKCFESSLIGLAL